jgi:hypothetical protein
LDISIWKTNEHWPEFFCTFFVILIEINFSPDRSYHKNLPIKWSKSDFEIVQNCARKVVHARQLASNWESLLRENIHPSSSIFAGHESIRRDYGTRGGVFPAILFWIPESFALNKLIFIIILNNIFCNLFQYFVSEHYINSSAQSANEFSLNSKL